MHTTQKLLSILLLVSILIPQQTQGAEDRRPKYQSSVVSLIKKCTSRDKWKAHYLVWHAYENRNRRAAKGYIVTVNNSQLQRARSEALRFLARGQTVNREKVLGTIHEAIERNITGAMVHEVRAEQLDRLLGGGEVRLSNSSLASDTGGDVDSLVLGSTTAAGAFAAVGTKGTAPMLWVFLSNGRIAGLGGLAVVTAGYGTYTAARGFFSLTGLNAGYNLGDVVYDLSHPQPEGNPVWGASSEADSSGGQAGESEPDTSTPSGGTVLPPEFSNSSDPGRNIQFQIALGLCVNQALSRNIVQRPTTLSGEPLPEADGATSLDFLMRVDELLGGAYFKLIERAITSRQTGTTTPLPETDAGSGRGPILIDYTRCPPADLRATRLNGYLSSQAGSLRRTLMR